MTKATTSEEYDAKLIAKGIKQKRLHERYSTQSTPILHQCLVCGHIASKAPKSVLKNSGCANCRVIGRTKTSQQYDEEIKDTRYRRVDPYITALTEILHECLDCGSVHKVRPQSVIRGHSCKFCANRATKGLDKYKEELLDRNIVCIDNEYKGNKGLLVHKCGVCSNEWLASPNNVISKSSGCPVCAKSKSSSKAEEAILEFLQQNYSGWLESHDRSILEGKELDIVLPDLGLCIEFNGTYWHKEDIVGKTYHLEKTEKVEAFGYQLIHIMEDVWKNKEEIVKSRLKSFLGISTKLYARNCIISEVPNAEATKFLEDNHLQGSVPASTKLGLYYLGNLVTLMTLGTPRFNLSYDFELLRFCTIQGITVVGGASRLLSQFLKDHKGSSIISYADRRWSQGNVYKKLGFTFIEYSSPSYRYYKGTKSLSRYECQKHKLVELGFDTTSTETEIMKQRGYHKVYDCGNSVWGLK